MAGRTYKQKDLESLFGLAAGRCSFQECRVEVIHWKDTPEEPVILGQIGHIYASSKKGPRPNLGLSAQERNAYGNLILLCSPHHKLVDTLDSRYSPDELRAYKTLHEQWVEEQLVRGMDRFSPAELEVVCEAIQAGEALPSTAMVSIPPQDKMAYNDLGPAADRLLRIGLMRSGMVATYLERMASHLDSRFPGRLRAGFVSEYEDLRSRGLRGDALFLALADFAAARKTEFERYAAGLAVLSHLFQVCEVFERPNDAAS